MMQSLLHVALATAALAMALPAATAQTAKPREATIGGGSGSGPMLTRDQLRECLVEQDALKTAREALARDAQAIDGEKADIARAGNELQEALGKLDRSNEEAVKAHVAKAQAHDQRIGEFNAKLGPFNERVQQMQARTERWKGSCADRRYREDDLILLQARKQVPPGAK